MYVASDIGYVAGMALQVARLWVANIYRHCAKCTHHVFVLAPARLGSYSITFIVTTVGMLFICAADQRGELSKQGKQAIPVVSLAVNPLRPWQLATGGLDPFGRSQACGCTSTPVTGPCCVHFTEDLHCSSTRTKHTWCTGIPMCHRQACASAES